MLSYSGVLQLTLRLKLYMCNNSKKVLNFHQISTTKGVYIYAYISFELLILMVLNIILNWLKLCRVKFTVPNCALIYMILQTWLLAGRLLGSPDSLPHEHFTVCPFTSLLWIATMAWAADSLVENLKKNIQVYYNRG